MQFKYGGDCLCIAGSSTQSQRPEYGALPRELNAVRAVTNRHEDGKFLAKILLQALSAPRASARIPALTGAELRGLWRAAVADGIIHPGLPREETYWTDQRS